MVVLSQSITCSDLIQAKLPIHSLKYNTGKLSYFNDVKMVVPWRKSLRGGIRKSSASGFGSNYAVGSGRNFYQSSFNDDMPQEPFPLTLVREALWAVRSLSVFLVEQPSQLKYIEWPSFLSTLKTATLTLVLVAVLIVALSSVDSALSYLLALILRRTA